MRTLEIDRTFATTPERMWEKWTTQEGLASWWWRHWDDVEISVDCRVGGRWAASAPGAGVAVGGEYTLVQPTSRLGFTWVWEDADGRGPVEQVTVDLVPATDAVHVTVRHSGPWADDAPAEGYRQGWEFTLDQLRQALDEA